MWPIYHAGICMLHAWAADPVLCSIPNPYFYIGRIRIRILGSGLSECRTLSEQSDLNSFENEIIFQYDLILIYQSYDRLLIFKGRTRIRRFLRSDPDLGDLQPDPGDL